MCIFRRIHSILSVFLVAGVLQYATSFYLPGLAPVSFCEKNTEKENEVPDCKVGVFMTIITWFGLS